MNEAKNVSKFKKYNTDVKTLLSLFVTGYRPGKIRAGLCKGIVTYTPATIGPKIPF